jgi:hypothetical protein
MTTADSGSVAVQRGAHRPLTSPVAVLMRLGSRSIAGPEIAAALALTLVCAAAALLVSSALLRRVTIAGAR